VLHRYDVAAALLGLENVEYFAHAGPQQLALGCSARIARLVRITEDSVHACVSDASARTDTVEETLGLRTAAAATPARVLSCTSSANQFFKEGTEVLRRELVMGILT